MKSNKALVVDFALTDREEDEPEEGEENAECTVESETAATVEGEAQTAAPAVEDCLSPNAERVQAFADELAAESEAEEASEDADESGKDDEDDDV